MGLKERTLIFVWFDCLFTDAIARLGFLAGMWLKYVRQIAIYFCVVNVWRCSRLRPIGFTPRCLQILASLPTATPESAGLCAQGLLRNLDRVTDFQ